MEHRAASNLVGIQHVQSRQRSRTCRFCGRVDRGPRAEEAAQGNQALGAPSPQAASHPPEDTSLVSTPTLIEHPVYFVSTVLQDARARYPMPQKLLLVLLVASRKLQHYIQGHPIKVVSAYPLERVLKSPNSVGRVAEWNI